MVVGQAGGGGLGGGPQFPFFPINSGADGSEDEPKQAKTGTQTHEPSNNHSRLTTVINAGGIMGPHKENGLENESRRKVLFFFFFDFKHPRQMTQLKTG